jgi:glucan biosynthesis protein C
MQTVRRPRAVSDRLFFLDNLRVYLAILVIVHHTAITYGAAGSWYYYEHTGNTVVNIFLSMVVAVNQFYFMGLFFFISGFFTPAAFDRKGAVLFLKDKLIRLGIPLVVFIYTLNPALNYISARAAGRTTRTFWQFYLQNVINFSPGPLWFVETLLIFGGVYTLFRLISMRFSHPGTGPKTMFTWGQSLIFALLLGSGTLITRQGFPIMKEVFHLQLAYFPQYIALYILGAVAYRRQWLENIPAQLAKGWLTVVVTIILLLPGIMFLGAGRDGDISAFFGGLSWQSAVNAFTEAFFCTGACISLLVLFRNRLNYGGKVAGMLGENTYPVYIIHGLVLILLSLGLRNYNWHPLIKFVAVVSLGSVISFLGSRYIIRRLPFAKYIF